MARPTNEQLRRQRIAKAVSKMKPETIQKLEDAFAIDCNVVQACLYANISTQTYYTWIEKNPDLSDRFTALRQSLPLKARKLIAERMTGFDEAMRYMVKKQPDEYGDRTQIEMSGKVQTEDVTQTEATRKVTEEYEAKLRDAIASDIRSKGKKPLSTGDQ